MELEFSSIKECSNPMVKVCQFFWGESVRCNLSQRLLKKLPFKTSFERRFAEVHKMI